MGLGLKIGGTDGCSEENSDLKMWHLKQRDRDRELTCFIGGSRGTMSDWNASASAGSTASKMIGRADCVDMSIHTNSVTRDKS